MMAGRWRIVSVRRLRRAAKLGAAFLLASLLLSTGPVSAPAHAFDLGSLAAGFKTKKQKPKGAFGNVKVRFSLFSNSPAPKTATAKKPQRQTRKSNRKTREAAIRQPAPGIVTAYERTKMDALVSGDPQAIKAANAMLETMFPGAVDEEKIASFDRLLGIALPLPQLIAQQPSMDDVVGSL